MARRTPWYVWAMPILMFFSVVFLVVETPRYRTPIDPFIVLLAAAALVTAARRALAAEVVGRSSLRTRKATAPPTPGGLTVPSARRRRSGPSVGGGRVLSPDTASDSAGSV